MQPASRTQPHVLHAVRFHLPQRAQDRRGVGGGEQALLAQHHRVGLVEGVERPEHEARASRGEAAQLGEHVLVQADPARAEPAILGRRLLQHACPFRGAPRKGASGIMGGNG